MGRQGTPATQSIIDPPPLLSPEEWERVLRSLRLPPRQASVVELILQGKQDKEIAVALGLRRSTVRTYLTRIFARVGVTNRVDLVLRVCANHLDSHRSKG